MTNSDDDNAMAAGASNDEVGRAGASSAPRTEQDPDQGADMSDTGGAQWDSVFQTGGIQNEPGLEGLQQDSSNTES